MLVRHCYPVLQSIVIMRLTHINSYLGKITIKHVTERLNKGGCKNNNNKNTKLIILPKKNCKRGDEIDEGMRKTKKK